MDSSLSIVSSKAADVVLVPTLALQHKMLFETGNKKAAQVKTLLRKGHDHPLLKHR